MDRKAWAEETGDGKRKGWKEDGGGGGGTWAGDRRENAQRRGGSQGKG